MRTLDVGQKQAAYTGVIVHAGQTEDGQSIDYSVGSDSGSVLEVTVPNGTLALAYMLLDKLKLRGYRYQPFEADGAIADPSIEIGDNITANNVPSIVMGINTNHSRLMASTLKAPFDEEVNHEWKYEPRSERQFKRESAYTRSRLTINENEISAEVDRASSAENVLAGRISVTAYNITAEVARATAAEGTMRSSIEINATEIAAKVSKSGGSSQSFGWNLTDSSWTLTSNNSTVLKATSAGIEVSGKITATSGYIGNGSSGFEIGNNYIRNGMTSLNDTSHNGVYVGTNGIALGAGAFKVTSSGAVTASNLSITGGSISIGSNFSVDSSGNLTANTGTFKGSVYAGNIQYGGNYGTFSGSGLTDQSIESGKYGLSSISNGNMVNSTLDTSKMVSGIGTSLGYANFSNSVFNNTDVAPYVTAQYYFIVRNNAHYSMSLHTHYFYVDENTGQIYMSSNGGESDSVDWTGGRQGFNIADTQYYKDAVDAAESAGAAGVEVNSIVITNIRERTTAYYVTVEIGLSNGETTTQTRLYNK